MGAECCSVFEDNDQQKSRYTSNNEEDYKNGPTKKPLNLSPNTKRAIATAHLFAKIIYEYFHDDANSCDVGTFDVHSILENMIVIGGACRDFLTGRSINDLDITLNNRELNKIQLLHLQKYHNNVSFDDSNKSKCVLWRHYLNKFNGNGYENDFSQLQKRWQTYPNEEKSYFQNLDYVLNAEFFMSLLRNSNELKDKLEVQYNSKWSWFQFIINKEIIYDGINLEGQDCDILELKDRKDKKQKLNAESLDQRFPSLRVENIKENIELKQENQTLVVLDENKENEMQKVPIMIPIYSVSLRDCFCFFDFSINMTYISFSNCLGLTDNDENGSYDVINYDWKPHIQNATENDSLNDIRRKILTHSRPTEMIKSQSPERHFWRIIKFGVRMPDWEIDSVLIDKHKQLYNSWIGNDKWLNDETHQRRDIKYLMSFMFKHKTVREWKRMLELYEICDFRDVFVKALSNEYVKQSWIQQMNGMETDEKDEISQLLKSRNYIV